MRRVSKVHWLLAAALAVLLAACSPPPPTVTLTAPDDGATVVVGSVVTIAGTATNAVGVEVLVDNNRVNEVVPSASGDWAYEWATTEVGEFAISATAANAKGATASTGSVTVTVTEEPATTGGISGIIERSVPATIDASSVTASELAPVVPGSVIVQFAPAARNIVFGTTDTARLGEFTFNADGGFTFAGLEFAHARTFPVAGGLTLYSVDGLDEQGTRDLVDQLRASPHVSGAFPNWILTTTAVPDDPLYYLQAWHYEALNLPDAWDIEDGSSLKTTVAVLDTGRYDHADVQWLDAAVPGANFVGWDGVAPVPAEGDIENYWTLDGGSPHGTHVAGTIGAVTDNADGVAGVNWNVDVLPVKVLGADGSGSFGGIIEALFWLTGDDDDAYGGWVNENVPQVVNMSLGGMIGEACPAELDAIFGFLAQFGIYTVTSAGNDGSSSYVYFPANCPSVITVGATGLTGARAYYSNFGPTIDVMAPGGDVDYPHPAEPENEAIYAGVLSTVFEVGYSFMQGTSMASPHVAGAVSLLLAQEPDLGLEEVRERLHAASVPLSAAQCNIVSSGLEGFNMCGAGSLDVAALLNGDSLITPTAVAYALPYEDGEAPALEFSDLNSLEALAVNRVPAAFVAEGTFTYSFDGLEPGSYLVVGLEQRAAETGVSQLDRIGFAEEVEVTAGETAAADVETLPIYYFLP